MIFNDILVGQKINWTSDHTPVSFSVSQTDTPPIFLMTWNKLNKCHSKLTCKATHIQQSYSNNPWNIDEDDCQYAKRVRLQRQYLIGVVEKSKGALDIICLQEVNDLLFGGDEINAINQKFQDDLLNLGWDIVKSKIEDNCKPLVVLFNRNRFDYVGQGGVLPSGVGKNSGLEVLFTDKLTGSKYAATNIHLEWNEDYRRSILDYQIKQVAKSVLTTICGDTNHPSGLGQISFVGNGNFPTNIDVNHLGHISASDDRNAALRNYNSLAASPAAGKRVSIIEKKGLYFAKRQGNYTIKEFNPERDYGEHPYIHKSEVGVPWIPLPNFANLKNCCKLANGIKSLCALSGWILVSEGDDGTLIFDLTQPKDHAAFKDSLARMAIKYKELQTYHRKKGWAVVYSVAKFDALPLLEKAGLLPNAFT